MEISINKDKLLLLLKKSYESGNVGYPDLCEVEAERILEEYLIENKNAEIKSNPYIFNSQSSYTITSGSLYIEPLRVSMSTSDEMLQQQAETRSESL